MEQDARYKLDDFELYRAARAFRKRVYALIRELPREEKFALDPQMRRAVISITNNIAEGHGRWHHQETMQFCRVSRGSVEEILDDVNVCIDEGYGSADENEEIKSDGYALIARINAYIAYLRRSRATANGDRARPSPMTHD